MPYRCSTDCQAPPRPRRAAGAQLWCLTNATLHSLATPNGSALALGCAGRPDLDLASTRGGRRVAPVAGLNAAVAGTPR
jgi:hypothetical protein